MAQKRVNFRTKVRNVEVEVSIDCQRIAEEVGRRLVWIKSDKATAVGGAVVVRRVRTRE
jgi:hypothetical protein